MRIPRKNKNDDQLGNYDGSCDHRKVLTRQHAKHDKKTHCYTATPAEDKYWNQQKPLSPGFFCRDATVVAKELLGKILVTVREGQVTAAVIVETEAYLGSTDAASHAFSGLTRRNRSMFERGGIAYVYLSYGMHHCVNAVTGSKGNGQGVLIRAVEPTYNAEAMGRRRGIDIRPGHTIPSNLTNGPGKLCQALAITVADAGVDLNRVDFKVVQGTCHMLDADIGVSTRIGITKATDLRLRFFVKGNRYVSPHKFRRASKNTAASQD